MSTGYKNKSAERILILARQGGDVFHINDLAVLWNIRDKNTLYTTLKRYIQRGLLFRIYRGFYSLKDLRDVDPVLLGIKALHRFAYLSTETVLVKAGVIFQASSKITLVSSLSRKFSLAGHLYLVRQLNDKFLFNPVGIEQKGGYYEATVERAVADLLYFNPYYFLDNPTLVNWQKVKDIQSQLGYPLLPSSYDSSSS